MNIYCELRERLKNGPADFYTSSDGFHSFEPRASAMCQRIGLRPMCVILGGGYVGQAVAKLASFIEMDTIVVDDRPEFSSKELFPDALKTIKGDFTKVMSELSLSPSACLVICTRGHQSDLECLRAGLGKPHQYIGMLGSKAKAGKLFSILRDEGISDAKLAEVCAPIGLQIGSETPSEIAVAVIAQIIEKTKQQNHEFQISRTLIDDICTAPEGSVVCSIMSTSGSVSRKSGFMLMRPDRTFTGTIGGGQVESLATEEAFRMLGTNDKPHFKDFEHNAADSSCWGTIKVLFEVIR